MRPLRLKPDAELLRATRSDSRAFAVFYRRHERAVLAFCGRLAGTAELGADVMAETFAQALENADRFDAARGNARAWLFGIARNVLGTSRRRGRVEAGARDRLGIERLVLSDQHLDDFAAVIAADGDAVVGRWLDSLPGAQREAVRLRVIEEESYSSIARTLETSQAVIRQRVSRGLAALRDQIGDEHDAVA